MNNIERSVFSNPDVRDLGVAFAQDFLQPDVLRFFTENKIRPPRTHCMLTQQLRDLERDGLVKREHYPEIPPRVEYTATEIALALAPVAKAIDKWGHKNMDAIHKARKAYDRRNS